jgi:hypothetical protein
MLAHIMQDVETLKMQSPFFRCRKDCQSLRPDCVHVSNDGQSRLWERSRCRRKQGNIPRSYQENKGSTGMPFIFMKDISLTVIMTKM